MEGLKQLFEECSEILLLKDLSDGEKIGYLTAVSQACPYIPSHIPLLDVIAAVRKYYWDNIASLN